MPQSKCGALPLGYEATLDGGRRWSRTIEPEGTDLQSAAFDHFAILPLYKWCRQRESNPQPTDYKSVALPITLCRQMVGDVGLEPTTPCL